MIAALAEFLSWLAAQEIAGRALRRLLQKKRAAR